MDLNLVPLKNNLLIDTTYNKVRDKIVLRINELGLQDPKYKNDNEFLALICNLIENLVSKKDKIDKKNLLIDIFKLLFNLDNEEIELLGKNVDFICNQQNIVKKISYYRLFKTGIKEWFKKK